MPGFRSETAALRQAEWSVTPPSGCDKGRASYLTGVESASQARAWRSGADCNGSVGSAGVILWLDSIWAAFEVDEILHELRDLVCAVTCDEDGYLFSFVETFQAFPQFVLPDRADITPGTHFLSSVRRLVDGVCRRRGLDIAGEGHEGPTALDRIEAADLLLVPRGRITERGIRQNIRVALVYLEGTGNDLPADDTARLQHRSAAKLAVAQLWQWVRHETGVLDAGQIVTAELFQRLLDDELSRSETRQGGAGAAAVLADTVLRESLTMEPFLEAAPGAVDVDV